MNIVTNHHKRQFAYRNEVPANVLADQFDHLDAADVDGFFRYRRYWYHVSDFTVSTSPELADWHGFHADSFFSGIAIRISEDGETYQVGLILA